MPVFFYYELFISNLNFELKSIDKNIKIGRSATLRASLGSVCGGLKDEDIIYKIVH